MTPRAAIAAVRARIDARTRRERLLLAASVLLVVLMLWEFTLRAPLSQQRTRAEQQAERLSDQTAELRTTIDDVEEQLAEARAGGEASRLERLRKRLDAVDSRLEARTQRLISPEQMVDVLRNMIAGDEALTLVALRNEPVEPIIEEERGDADEGAVPRVYRHGVEVTVEGEYFAVLAYLQRLEGLDWAFQWRRLEIERVDYPRARATLSLATLSLAEDWIGV